MKYRIPAFEAHSVGCWVLGPFRLHKFAETASNINWDGSMINVALSSCHGPQSPIKHKFVGAIQCPKMNTHVLVYNSLGEVETA